MTGAPIISGYSALKGGAGLVTLVVREDIYPLVVSNAPPELMVVPVKDYHEVVDMPFDSLAIGPGLGRGDWENEVLDIVIRHSTSRH